MSNVSNISITHRFNGDISARQPVNAAQLDTQLGNEGAKINEIIAAINTFTDNLNNLAAGTVGMLQLKEEVLNHFKAQRVTNLVRQQTIWWDGAVIYCTDTQALWIGNGTTPGGVPVAGGSGAGGIPAHSITHAFGGSDPVTLAESQITNLVADLAGKETTGAAATVQTNLNTHTGLTTTAHGGIIASTDPRLTDSRTPTAHVTTHAPAGSDPLPWTTAHGRGLASARPAAAASNAGYIYFSSDTAVLERSTGAAWESIGSSITLSNDREVNSTEPPASTDSRLRTPFTINYCKEPDAETAISVWIAYADAAGTQPIDGTGGSPNTSITIDGGSLSRGTSSFRMVKNSGASRQGEGVSYAFTIDAADCSKSLSVAFLAFLQSGSYTSGAVSVWVYDVTNARMCPINYNIIDALSTTPSNVAIQWSSSSSTSYRLIIHIAGTDTTAYGFGFDQVYIGPTYLPSSPAMSDWQTYTPTISGCGTVTANTAEWRRIGDTLEVSGAFTAGTPTAALAGISLPGVTSAGTIDGDSGANTHLVGEAVRSVAGAMAFLDLIIQPNETQLSASIPVYAGTSSLSKQNGSAIIAVGERVSWKARVKIAGWSGSTAVQPGSRYLWAQRFAANAVRVTAAPSKPGEYRSRRIGVDTVPGTAPSASNGLFYGSSSTIGAGTCDKYDVYIGPGKVVQLQPFGSAGRTNALAIDWFYTGAFYFGTQWLYDPSTGIVTFWAPVATAGDLLGGNNITNYNLGYVDILVADDPVPVAIAPAVHVEASSDAGQVLTANTTDAQWEDITVNTSGAWSGTIFTAPVSGIYEFHTGWGTSAGITPEAWKNGTLYMSGAYNAVSTMNTVLSGSLKLAAGDTLKFRTPNNATRDVSVARNYLRITRIGDA